MSACTPGNRQTIRRAPAGDPSADTGPTSGERPDHDETKHKRWP
jgi:hypothetical protein